MKYIVNFLNILKFSENIGDWAQSPGPTNEYIKNIYILPIL